LLSQGIVTKLTGRGGRTALVVKETQKKRWSGASVLRPLAYGLFGIASAVAVVGVIYFASSSDVENWLLNSAGLIFGAITIAAAGLSLLIFILQDESGRLEGERQAAVQARLTELGEEAAAKSSGAFDILERGVKPAAAAASSADHASDEDLETAQADEAATPSAGDATGLPAGSVVEREDGIYYLPPAVPLKVLADLVTWWKAEGENGGWTISRLVGGYRAFNSAKKLSGKPWILTFRSSDGRFKSFRLAYSGKGSGPHVSEYDEGVGWHDL
jgi:hypothetical protein